jgi:hypothetical protein
MKKIKVTENQAKMLQMFDTPKNIKITERQLNLVLESLGQQVSSNFKKYGKQIKGFRVEAAQTPLVYNQQIVELYDFAKEIIEFLKGLMIKPGEAGFTPVWEQMGSTRNDVYKLMRDLGIVSIVENGSGKEFRVIRKNLKRKIKNLYDSLTQNNKPVTDIDEDSGYYPSGAENDPSAPYNDNSEYTQRKKVPITYKVIYYNPEIAILENNGGLYYFYYENIDEKDFIDYSEVPYEHTRDGYEYYDFDIDGEAIQGYVNDNIKHLSMGSGLDDFEQGVDFIKIDKEVKDAILSTWPNEKLAEVLSQVIETTGAAGSSGAFVGKLQLGELETTTTINQDGYLFFILNRDDRKILGGNEYKEDVVDYFNELKEMYPDKNIGVYTLKYLVSKGINPNDDQQWSTNNGIKETTVAGASGDGGSSGPYIQPKIWAKSKKDHKLARKSFWPNGKMVGQDTENAIEGIHEDAQSDTQYPKGEFVKLDDCTKLNNNKEAQNGGCSQGSVDNVVKMKSSKNSVISKEGIYNEIAKKTGKTIEEVTSIISNYKKPLK